MAGSPPLSAIVEAMIFAADRPPSARQLASQVEGISSAAIRQTIEVLNREYKARGSGLEIVEVAQGYRLVTRPECGPWVKAIRASGLPPPLSQAALETGAVIAYRQPVTRAQIEEIRGVQVETVLRTLLDRGLIRVVGRAEGPGRPLLYGTTDRFLTYFGLRSLEDLPPGREIEDLLGEGEAGPGEMARALTEGGS